MPQQQEHYGPKEFIEQIWAVENFMAQLSNWINRVLVSFAYITFYPITLLIRYAVGERYLNASVLVLSSFLYLIVAFFARSNSGYWLVAVFWLAAILHYAAIRYRRYKRIEWHSQCPGISWWEFLAGKALAFSSFPNGCPRWFICYFVEPATLLAIALLWWMFLDWISVLIALSAVGLVCQYWTQIRGLRHLLLEQIDQKLEAEYLSEALTQEHKTQDTGGVVIPAASMMASEIRDMVKSDLDHLDPALKDLLKSDKNEQRSETETGQMVLDGVVDPTSDTSSDSETKIDEQPNI